MLRRDAGMTAFAGCTGRLIRRMRIMTARARAMRRHARFSERVLVGMTAAARFRLVLREPVRRVAVLTARVTVREERVWLVVTIRAAFVRDRGRCMRTMAAEAVLRLAGRQIRVRVLARCVAGETRTRLERDWIVEAMARAARLACVDIDRVQLALRQHMAAHAAGSFARPCRTEVVATRAVDRPERIVARERPPALPLSLSTCPVNRLRTSGSGLRVEISLCART
jgi:hypothetical protein